MANQKIDGKSVKVTGMSVAGGSLTLPKNHKYFLNMTLKYDDVSFEEVIALASGGSSVRVQAQAKLRGDEATCKKHGVVAESLEDAIKAGLEEMAPVVFDVAVDFESEGRGPRDPQKTAASAFSKMDREQKIAFVMGTMGVDKKTAEGLVK